MARVTLSQAGEDVIVGGSDVQVIGTSAGGEIITVISGNIRLDPSFNQGGDTIVLPGLAANYTAYRAGGEVIFTRNDGLVTLRIPVGTAGTEIQFDGGDSRTLQFNTNTGQATLEGQVIGTSSTSPTPVAPSGPPPVTGYDVVGSDASVVEGDSGTRLLVFTISLDRAVTAADGPLTLNFQTQDGTASSASDYVAAAGTVTFAVGQSVATVSIVVNGDVVPEAAETLSLRLTGTGLRNGPETLTGTISNDDNAVSLTNNADNLQGSGNSDTFFAANTNLGAGDKISDTSTTDNDTLSLAVDATTGNRTFGGFALTNIENLEVTNDSGAPVTLDLSSSTGLRTVASVNSSDSVVFNELTSRATVIVDNVTGAGADVTAIYQAAVTAGAGTEVSVIVNDATADEIVLGTVGQGNVGIETVNLTVSGTSTINAITTALTQLNIGGGGDVTINNPLNASVRTINAANAGRVTVDFSSNDFAGQEVNFTGSNGNDVVRGGLAANTISTGAGNDSVTDDGGNDTITTGSGTDSITLLGAGDVTIDTGIDGDTVSFAAGTFNGSDKVALGDGSDTLVVSQATAEASFVGVTSAETLTVNTQTTTDLGSNGLVGSDTVTLAQGQIAGIQTVNLNLAGNGGASDVLTATDYTSGLTVNLGGVAGTDTVLLGTGADVINTASLDDSDNLQGNKGADTLNVTGGVTITTASLFSGIETINLAGGSSSVAVDNSNAPTDNGVLTVNAGGFTSAQVLTFNSTSVNAFGVNVTSGAAADVINTQNIVADVVTSGAGNDKITAAGGDTVNAGAGIDTINLGIGNNTVFAGGDDDTINFGGPGDNKIFGEGGNDTFFVINTGDLTAADVLDGGDGTDTVDIIGTVVDAQFTNASSVEVLIANGATGNFTIAAEAQEAGIRTVTFTNTGVDVLNAAAYTAGLTVNTNGGNDTITTGSGADIVNLNGAGTYTIATGAGDDRIRTSGVSALDFNDKIAAGDGNDVVELDNTNGTVVAAANLANVTGVDTFRILANGDVGNDGVVDVNANILTIGSTVAEVFADVTTITFDASALTDKNDSAQLIIDASLQDDDVAFRVVGSSTTTIVEKRNINVDNNIDFVGGTGRDELRIDGADAGSTVKFDGGTGADDVLFQTGGLLTDDGFVGISNVEVLSGNLINATLGVRAAAAGISRVEGTAGNDVVTLGAGFNRALEVRIGGGNDTINGSATNAAVTFVAAAGDVTSADILSGGQSAGDVFNLTAGGTADLTNVTRVETINVNNVLVGNEATVINLDATAAEVDGTLLTVNVINSENGDTLVLNGGTVTERVLVNAGAGNDTITTGSADDTVNGNGGDDTITTNGGNDTVNAGAGTDMVFGGAGIDTINGDAGNDTLNGGDNNDIINGGADNDLIIGGLGADNLTGGTGVDTFRYLSVEDSRFSQTPGGSVDNRDTIVGFTAGEDKIDVTALAGSPVRFNGSFQTYAQAQAAVGGSTAGDGFLDAVYVQELRTLFVDVDNNGQIDGNDLQIVMDGLVGSLSTSDFIGTVPPSSSLFGAEQSAQFVGVAEDYSAMRFDHSFASMHIA